MISSGIMVPIIALSKVMLQRAVLPDMSPSRARSEVIPILGATRKTLSGLALATVPRFTETFKVFPTKFTAENVGVLGLPSVKELSGLAEEEFDFNLEVGLLPPYLIAYAPFAESKSTAVSTHESERFVRYFDDSPVLFRIGHT
jgi:hypothetical protein